MIVVVVAQLVDLINPRQRTLSSVHTQKAVHLLRILYFFNLIRHIYAVVYGVRHWPPNSTINTNWQWLSRVLDKYISQPCLEILGFEAGTFRVIDPPQGGCPDTISVSFSRFWNMPSWNIVQIGASSWETRRLLQEVQPFEVDLLNWLPDV